MNDLKNTTKLVKAILEQDGRARNDDNYLYLAVCRNKNPEVNYGAESFQFVINNMKHLGLPGFETVRRTRQKIQQHHPELAACPKVQDLRMIEETEFRRFARGEV